MIINYINSIENISANSTTGIINISNKNFTKISELLYKFFTDIDYDEETVGMTLGSLESDVIKLNSKIEMIINDTAMFTVDSNGQLFAKNIYAGTVSSSLINRHVYYEGFPKYGHPGDIVYGRNSDHPTIDLYGYIQNLGWLSLTGQGGGGTPSISEVVNWNGAVIRRIAEGSLPEPPEKYGRYLVSSGEHAGQIAQYNFLTEEYEFVIPDDGTFIIDESTGDVLVYDSTENKWNTVIASGIGKSENNDGYKNGINTDFTEKTPVGTAVDRFNKQINLIYSESLLAYKNIMNVANTSDYTNECDEAIGGGINLSGEQVFVDYISELPDVAVESGVAEYIENASLELIQKDIDSSYRVFMRRQGVKEYFTKIISPYYGYNYRVTVYDQFGVEIDPKYYALQYASGVLYCKKELPSTQTPTKVSFYNYIGQTANDIVQSTSVRLSFADNEKYISSSVETNMKNNPNVPILTGLVVSEEPRKKSDVVVKVNGVAVIVGRDKDCYFNKVNTAKTFENIEKGDELVWNSQNVGYILDSEDVVTFDYLVNDGNSGGSSPEPTPGGGSMTVTLVAGENLVANSFVHIVNDRKVYYADSEVDAETEADGFIVEDASEGEDVVVYLNGVIDVPAVYGNVGDYVYLKPNGEYSSTFDSYNKKIIQNVASIVDTDKLYINIYEPIVLEE